MKHFFVVFVCAVGLIALSACSPSAAAVDPNNEQAVSNTNSTLLSLTLTNARTGETFSLADFAGKVVYVEPMATWCTNCRHQLGRVRDAYAQLDASEYVFVSISVETNISSADLATYADNQEFPWIFAVASPDMLTTLSEQYGNTVLVPPTTPHFIISPDGTISNLYTGVHEAADLVTLLQAMAGA